MCSTTKKSRLNTLKTQFCCSSTNWSKSDPVDHFGYAWAFQNHSVLSDHRMTLLAVSLKSISNSVKNSKYFDFLLKNASANTTNTWRMLRYRMNLLKPKSMGLSNEKHFNSFFLLRLSNEQLSTSLNSKFGCLSGLPIYARSDFIADVDV